MIFKTLDLYLGYIVFSLLKENDQSDIDNKNFNDKVSSALGELKGLERNKDLNLDVDYLNLINKLPKELLDRLLLKLNKRYKSLDIKGILTQENMDGILTQENMDGFTMMYLLNDILYYTTYMLIINYHNSVNKDNISSYNGMMNEYLKIIELLQNNKKNSNYNLEPGEFSSLNLKLLATDNKLPELPRELLTELSITSGGNAKVKKINKKEILGRERCIYKKAGDRKEYLKHKGELITVKDYKKQMKVKK